MKYLIISIIALTVSVSSFGQDSKYKALFIYKFLQNIEWPSGSVGETYVVAVSGASEVKEQLSALTTGRIINGKPIKVIDFTGTMSGINLLFLGNNEMDSFDELNKNTTSSSVLLVTESSGLGKRGAGINFISQGGKLKFEMNLTSLESSKLSVSGSIKSLAILVN